MSNNIEQALATAFTVKGSPSVPLTVVSQYLARAFLHLLKWWSEAKMPSSPGRMDEIFQQLALLGVWAIIKGKSEETKVQAGLGDKERSNTAIRDRRTPPLFMLERTGLPSLDAPS